ncbi:hypothetical protein ACQB60_13985 [Actinomycetota bacterium Odt1-20B]
MPGIDACLCELMALPGARGASLVDWTSGFALGAAGNPPHGLSEKTTAETAELARTASEFTTFQPALTAANAVTAVTTAASTVARPRERPKGDPASPPPPPRPAPGRAAQGAVVEDLMVTTRTHYHLLRFVDTALDTSVFLHLWLDRSQGNLAVARLRLHKAAEHLVLE